MAERSFEQARAKSDAVTIWRTRGLKIAVLIVTALLFVALASYIARSLLMIFAGVLVAIFLDALAGWLSRRLHTVVVDSGRAARNHRHCCARILVFTPTVCVAAQQLSEHSQTRLISRVMAAQPIRADETTDLDSAHKSMGEHRRAATRVRT